MGDVKRSRASADPVGYLSLPVAAAALNLPGKPKSAATRLRRVLLAKEREHSVKIMLRMGETRPWFAVTMPLLRQWCPELFSARDELVAMVREEMSELREQVDELTERDAVLASEIGACVGRVERVEIAAFGKKMAPFGDTRRHAPVNG